MWRAPRASAWRWKTAWTPLSTEPEPDADILRLFKERGAFQVSTISPAVPYALFDRSISHATYEQQANGLVVFEGIVALRQGVSGGRYPRGTGHRHRLPLHHPL